MKPVEHMKIKKGMNVNDLVKEMKNAGFTAGKIGRAADILEKMIKDKDCKVFFGLAGAMVPAGMKEIIMDMLRNHYIDVFVTTGANLTHDLIEALGHRHYKGCEHANDVDLREKGIDRIYDVFMKNEVYGSMEDFFKKIFDKLPKQMNIKEFIWEIGKYVEKKDSILRICYEEKIPVYCPAISDCGIGLMIWGNLVSGKKVNVDTFDDLKEILDEAWTAKKTGVFYLNGGFPKNYIQQAMQFSNKGGADYGIQITMARVEDGGSSGALLKEGISWGKMSPKGDFVTINCDSTIAMPLIYGAVKERIYSSSEKSVNF